MHVTMRLALLGRQTEGLGEEIPDGRGAKLVKDCVLEKLNDWVDGL
jgi:hypothetical protein